VVSQMKQSQILGIGIDIEDIARFKKLDLNKNNPFLNKIFTPFELDYCFSKKNTASSLATKYSGKEAVVKAFGSINIKNLDYKEIEIINDESGVPRVKLFGKNTKGYQVIISLSDESQKVVGVAIVTK
jgi:holo-[acyl-carrier protein] synthase